MQDVEWKLLSTDPVFAAVNAGTSAISSVQCTWSLGVDGEQYTPSRVFGAVSINATFSTLRSNLAGGSGAWDRLFWGVEVGGLRSVKKRE